MEGEIVDMHKPAKILYVSFKNGEQSKIILDEESDLFDEEGKNFLIHDLGIGFRIRVTGEMCAESFCAREARIIEAPDIIVFSPGKDDTVGKSFVVSGKTRLSSQILSYKLSDNTSRVLLEGTLPLLQYGDEVFREFNTKIEIIEGFKSEGGTLEVYSQGPGLESSRVSLPLIFQKERERVKVFFSSRKEKSTDCSRVYPVERILSGESDMYTETVEHLLKGPTKVEETEGFFTSIPEDTTAYDVFLEEGVVWLDFSEELSEGGGSCMMTARKAQIEETMFQFLEVKDVVISQEGIFDDSELEGLFDGILEP